MKIWTEEEITDFLKTNLKPGRYRHVQGVVQAIDQLAVRHEVDRDKARLCALYHDIMKENKASWLVSYIESNGEDPRELIQAVKVLHAQAGAIFARVEGGIEDKDILNAIRYHTTGREEMSTLEKILYLADVIEEGRHYEGVQNLRELAMNDLDLAMLGALNDSIRFLVEKDEHILFSSVEARNYYLDIIEMRKL